MFFIGDSKLKIIRSESNPYSIFAPSPLITLLSLINSNILCSPSPGFKRVSNTHFYPYIYAPIGKSIYSILNKIFTDKRRLKGRIKKLQDIGPDKYMDITAVHQLLLVIPRRSVKIIPQEVIDVYDDYMTIISPTDFVIKHEGTNTEWHRTAIIPPINLNLVSFALSQVANYKLPERLTETEPLIIENTQYVPKRKINPKFVKQKMDKFNKTTDYSIKNVELI